MIGQVFKIHSDFYYVKLSYSKNGKDTIECKLREVLKKQKDAIKVGDFVEIEDGVAICKILKRRNILERPSVSNLDLVVVVSSLYEPALNFTQLNRYITFLKYHKIPVLLCFNKDDLTTNDEISIIADKIKSIYEPIGYKTVFTSAVSKNGLDELKKLIEGKTIAFTGQSGVGKSSILNALNPKFNIRTKNVSEKLKRGTHTTRHCEILEFGNFKIIDTPGFSRLSFDFILPKDLGDLFDEINLLKNGCKYSDCLHLPHYNDDCNVVKNLDKIDISRYQSYLEFLKEAKNYKTKVTYEGCKEENTKKIKNNKMVAMINSKKREDSRKKTKQATRNIHLEEIPKNDE